MILGQQNAQNMQLCHWVTRQKAKRRNKTSVLNDPNHDLFTSFGRDFLREELLTETLWSQQNETSETGNSIYKITEQTERTTQNQKVEDVNNFIVENRKKKGNEKKMQSNLNVLYWWEKSVSETRGSSSETKWRRIWARLSCVHASVTKFRP